ncbi:MAG: hypothetical protein K6F50_08985 [Kiritimatiellae bacterium]|nr:hypothetical protein [Kiritimatiellia bacterium]
MDGSKIEEAVERLLLEPKSVEVDGQRVENQSIGDLIEADRYLASKKALKRRAFPVRVAKMASGGGAL